MINYTQKFTIECLLGIERAILSSLISINENIAESIEQQIDSNDFYYSQHGIIYNTIVQMHKDRKIIDENSVFLENQNNINEENYIDVIATTPLNSVSEYLKTLKKYSIEREVVSVASRIKEGDFSTISKLKNLHEELENLGKNKKLNDIDDNFEALIEKLDIDDLKDIKIEYLFENFIIKNEITMIVSRPGIGKSLVSLALSNILLQENKIKRVIYLDGDNSLITVKSRNIETLKEKHGKKLNYLVGLSNNKYYEVINSLQKIDLRNILIIFDSIKNFIIGDRNSHKDVTEMMNILKNLRNNSGTILFLHHQNKLNKEFNSAFAGSSAFLEDVSLAYELKKNEDNQSYIFLPLKDRNNISAAIAFRYHMDNTLELIEIEKALQTNEELEIIELICNFINSSPTKPIYSEIMSYMADVGFNKDKINKIIQDGKGKYWQATRVERENNKLLFDCIGKPDKLDKLDKSSNGAQR